MEQNSIRTVKKKRSFKQVDKYFIDITQVIGESYLSKVYRAFDEENPHQIFACKVIERKDIDSYDELKKLVQKWKDFKHPNVIKVYDYFLTKNHLYLIMEFCAGGYLFSTHQPLEYKQMLQLYKQIIEGSIYLAKQLVIDQILTPENILFHQGVPKIDLSVQYKEYELLKRSYIPMRFKYFSPQAYEGIDYTYKNIVWSLGIIIYEQYYQRDPFDNQFINLIQRLNIIKKCETIQFFNNKELSENIKNLIINMLKIEENERLSMEQVYQIIISLEDVQE